MKIATAPAASQRFSYQARDGRGHNVTGLVAASSLTDATRILRLEGKYIVDIKPSKSVEAPAGGGPTIRTGPVKRDEIINFTIQLSVMVDTGVPLSDALQSLSDQSNSDGFGAVVKMIVGDVTGGKDFSSSLEKFPRVFPKYYTSLVRASEISGTMGMMLKRLAEYLVSQRETAKKVKGALIYPAFMMVMSVCVSVFLLTFVLPKFTAIFASRKVLLPLPTRIVMAISGTLMHHWMAWIVGSGLAAVFLLWFNTTPRGIRTFDYIKLHLPVFGTLFHKLYLSRSLQTVATMIQAGVPVMDCLNVVRDVSGNTYYAELWEDVKEKLHSGQQLSEPLLKSPLIPRSIGQMIHSAEKAGQLPSVMNRIALYMEDDLKTAIKTSTQFIEPIMITMMGILIGGVAIAMLLPILTISQVMAKG